MRRLVFTLVVGAVVLIAAPAWANEELAPYLVEQASAEFSGEQSVVCHTPDGVISELFAVRQAGGIRVIEDAEGAVGVGRVSHGESWSLGPQYRVELVGPDRFLSRGVNLVEVKEGSLVRVLLVFDRGSGALLASDVHNADGSIYCASRFIRFQSGAPHIPTSLIDDLATGPLTGPPVEFDRRDFPDRIAGFELVTVNAGPAPGISNGYYADGIFSFTLFLADRPMQLPELEESPPVVINEWEYQRRFYPGQVLIGWETSDGGILLVGDLPLDLQEAVLEELPEPGRPNFFIRFWRGLFG